VLLGCTQNVLGSSGAVRFDHWGPSQAARGSKDRPLMVQSTCRGCMSLRSRLWSMRVGLQARAMALMQRLLAGMACTRNVLDRSTQPEGHWIATYKQIR